MKRRYEELKEIADSLTIAELQQSCLDFARDIIKADSSLLSVRKQQKGYGYYVSVGFVNPVYFGTELAGIITKALGSKFTNDADYEFTVSEFEQNIYEFLFEAI